MFCNSKKKQGGIFGIYFLCLELNHVEWQKHYEIYHIVDKNACCTSYLSRLTVENRHA